MHSDIKQDFDKLQPFFQAQRNEGLNEKKQNDTTERIKTKLNQFLNFTMLHKKNKIRLENMSFIAFSPAQMYRKIPRLQRSSFLVDCASFGA